MGDYGGKNVFVTGGSSGIGLAAARLFASRGANVMIFARRHDALREAMREIETARISDSQRFSSAAVDVSDYDEVLDVMAKAVDELGAPQVLVNSAGVAYPDYFWNISLIKFNEILQTNLYGTRNTIDCLLPSLKKQGGHIVNISSMAGLIGIFGYTAYSASKFAVVGFSECLRTELKPCGITVSVLCPPDTDTPQLQEEGRTKPAETKAIAGGAGIMNPDRVARALLKGMEKGTFIIIPGIEGKLIFLAKRLSPALVERFMDWKIEGAARRHLGTGKL